MELMFFTAAHTVQFGFVAKKCWQHIDVLAVAEQHLHSIKALSIFPTLFLQWVCSLSVRVGEKLGGNMAGTADPDSPKRYSDTCNIVLGNKNWGRGRSILKVLVSLGEFFLGSQGSCYLEEGWTSVSLVGGGEWFPLFSVFLFTDKTVFILIWKFSDFVLSHLTDGDEEWTLCGCLAAGWSQLKSIENRWSLVKFLNGQWFRFLCLWSTGAEVTWSPLVTEFGLCSSFAKFSWSESYGYW